MALPAAAADRLSLLRGTAARHSILIASVSTLVVLAALVVLFLTAPGAPRIRDAFFSPPDFADSAGMVWDGFVINIEMMLAAEAIVLVWALIIAVARSIPGPAAFPLRALAIIYVDVFRGIPLILVVFILGLGAPALGISWLYTRNPFIYGLASLVLVYSAYVAEVYRAGIESVHSSQVAAARALSLSHFQSLRYVVVPQAVRRVIPPLLNDFISLQKDTALVSLLGVLESARQAQSYAAVTFNFTGYTVAAVYFLVLTIPLARFTDYLIERDRRRMRVLGG
ncbi:MAG: amino acid ABC transporter permease [Actinomycetota bacterium]|nr:amino acid ABC transporter permease [Actinomycetota bacterium]